ncbi:MAG: biopolymer transporter ExbD [Candidatus Babeliales bacterium]
MRFKKYAEYIYGLQPVTTVPFINILFLVFIIGGLCFGYMPTGSGVVVQVPRAITSEAVKGPAVEITIFPDGSMHLNGQLLTVEGLQSFLEQTAGRNQTIVINADSRTPWEHVIRAWDAVRASGMRNCVVATHP